jgi:hypothetical protein
MTKKSLHIRTFRNNCFLLFIWIFSVIACHENPEDEIGNESCSISEVELFTNADEIEGLFDADDGTHYEFYLDYQEAIDSGFSIPGVQQVKGGKMAFSFQIKNHAASEQKFLYKLYYQNESYKFPEILHGDSSKIHPFCHENFYGSWEDASDGFHQTPVMKAGEEIEITDSIRIIGNPRNESKYYHKGVNGRWKRNPRTGMYSFLLVVTTEDEYSDQLPDYISRIDLPSEKGFVNPYYYFLFGEGKKWHNTTVLLFDQELKVIANPKPAWGVFTDKPDFKKAVCQHPVTVPLCGNSDKLYQQAAFKQFVHYISEATKMENIPVLKDVLHEPYSIEDYNWNKAFYASEELISMAPSTVPCPCEGIEVDKKRKSILLKNKAASPGDWKKQNIGIITRHGFTYGKYTVKAKLTELLNQQDVWNGITNAIWLIYQGGSWNMRRNCTKEGFLSSYYGGNEDARVPSIAYSEIDFEILKTVPYCPSYTFPPVYGNPISDKNELSSWNIPFPEELTKDQYGMISVSCTNWDMACPQPELFTGGCQEVWYGDTLFYGHRWSKLYRALTEKSMQPDDELFGSDYYYFQIDWRPTEIIWRIGPEKDQMKVVGYMSDKHTSIPNNQMLLIITQEFHNTRWWPGSPYDQHNIPFPKKDIIGEVLELWIE